MKRHLTQEENALFDERMRYWQGKLGLTDWRIERGSFKTTAMAAVKMNHSDRLASYSTGNFGKHDPTAEIDPTALHEVLHVFLADMLAVHERTNDAELRMSAEHRVVTTLEKLLIGR